MEMKVIQVEVPAAVEKFSAELSNFVMAVEKALSDGWQPGQDIPAIISSSIQDLVPAISDLKGAGDDLKAAPYASAKAMSIHMTDMVEALIEKKK
jgi:hypothetical protein